MKPIRCILGIHNVASIHVAYGIDVEILPGSKAALTAHCSCGQTKLLFSPVPIYLVRYKLPKPTHKLVPIEDKEEANG